MYPTNKILLSLVCLISFVTINSHADFTIEQLVAMSKGKNISIDPNSIECTYPKQKYGMCAMGWTTSRKVSITQGDFDALLAGTNQMSEKKCVTGKNGKADCTCKILTAGGETITIDFKTITKN